MQKKSNGTRQIMQVIKIINVCKVINRLNAKKALRKMSAAEFT